jgi:two-component system KDP operon response regulator KdpE
LSSAHRAEATILLVEDEPGYVDLLSISLTSRGYDVVVARDGASALIAADRTDPDVTVLDLGLPDVDGLEVCRHLRRTIRTPIVVVTADGAEARKVSALTEGADDYITKPFSVPELLARIRVALRHRRLLAQAIDGGALVLGDLTVDTDARLALVAGEALALEAKGYALLEVLARNAGRVMTHAQLLQSVWGSAGTQTALRTTIAQLRRKLGAGPQRPVIEAHPGVGYRLHVPR